MDLQTENRILKEALIYLIETKERKDKYGKDSIYIERQKIAWIKARNAIKRFAKAGSTNDNSASHILDIGNRRKLLLAFSKFAMPNNYTEIALNNIVNQFIEESK